MAGTLPHCSSQNKHLKVVVSASLASSMMSPTELAVSEAVSDMMEIFELGNVANLRSDVVLCCNV